MFDLFCKDSVERDNVFIVLAWYFMGNLLYSSQIQNIYNPQVPNTFKRILIWEKIMQSALSHIW